LFFGGGVWRFFLFVLGPAPPPPPTVPWLRGPPPRRGQGWHLQLPPQETLAVANHPAYRREIHGDRDEG
jgi:hypothetical protein